MEIITSNQLPRILCPAIAFLSLALAWASVALGEATQHSRPSRPNRGTVLQVFKKARALNEAFKEANEKSARGEVFPDEYLKKREAAESYDEEVLAEKLRDGVRLLSAGSDRELALEFFKLLLSYENSADEELSSSLGEVFLYNPSLVEETFKNFPQAEQESL